MLYTLIVAAQFWVRELGGTWPETVAEAGTVAGAVAGAGTVAGAGAETVAGAGAEAGTGAAWCCLKRAFLSWAC